MQIFTVRLSSDDETSLKNNIPTILGSVFRVNEAKTNDQPAAATISVLLMLSKPVFLDPVLNLHMKDNLITFFLV